MFDLLLVPQMVAGGDDVHAGVQDFARGVDRDARAAGGVFAVGNDEVKVVGLAQSGQEPAQRVPPRLADNVPDKKKIHKPEDNPRRDAGKFLGGQFASTTDFGLGTHGA